MITILNMFGAQSYKTCRPQKFYKITYVWPYDSRCTPQGSISSTFYRQLLHQQSYAIPTGTQRRAQSVKVERIFQPCVLVKLGVFLLVKPNGACWQRMTTSSFALCAIRLEKSTLDNNNKVQRAEAFHAEYKSFNCIRKLVL